MRREEEETRIAGWAIVCAYGIARCPTFFFLCFWPSRPVLRSRLSKGAAGAIHRHQQDQHMFVSLAVIPNAIYLSVTGFREGGVS